MLDPYWTVDELAAELGWNRQKLIYAVKGRPERGKEAYLPAKKVCSVYLIADADAYAFIAKYRGAHSTAA